MIVLGALDAWFFRNWNVNPDGVSYFDLARAVAAHGPAAALNGYWSPLYPVALGVLLKVVRPSQLWMYPLVRALSFAIFVATTVAFDRLVRVACRQSPAYQGARPWARAATMIALWDAYALFVLKGVGLFLATPDMGVAFFVFWVSGSLLKLAAAHRRGRWWAWFGVVLAVGYWWKAILFPVGGLALLITFAIAWRRRDPVRGPVWAATTFGVLALCLIVPVSRLAGRPTFSETGRLNQLWYVNWAPYSWSLCVGPDARLPLARVKTVRTDSVLATRPRTCALPDRWPEATFPMWYDPSWWYRDTKAYVDVGEQWRAVRVNVSSLRDDLHDTAPLFAAGMLLVAIAALATWSSMGNAWPLALLSAGATAFYLLVYVEFRHVAAFFSIAVITGLFALLADRGRWRVALLAAVAAAGVADLARSATRIAVTEIAIMRHEIRGDPRPEQLTLRVARELAAKGLLPGDRLATVGTLWNTDWAQRGGFRVRAYVPEYTVDILHTLDDLRDPCRLSAWTDALARDRIDAVVLSMPKGERAPSAFEPLDDTGYYLLRIGRVERPVDCPGT
ncbi:MAG: hypothetical protein HY084_08660 [Gemmatimonadetes bacterium]|nr:hypothetical protein [Gemmatimonadota bacterium]